MSEFEKTIKEAIEPKEGKKSYGEVMRERRTKLNEMSAKAYSDIACDRKAFVAMLDTASRFLRNSVGNIMLIYAQNPKAILAFQARIFCKLSLYPLEACA